MSTPSMNGARPPYSLPSNVIFFHDWRYVDGSYLGWMGPDKEPLPLMPAPIDLPPIYVEHRHVPYGVRIEAMPCHFDDAPVLTARELDELVLMNGSVLYEDGRYRLFYGSFDSDTFSNPDKSGLAGFSQSMRYAESQNGQDWSFPDVGFADGKSHSNAVLKPASGWHGGCVFKEDDAPLDERYKAFYLGGITDQQLQKYCEKYPHDVDPMAIQDGHSVLRKHYAALALFGAVSPNGFDWKVLDEPLLVQHSDSFQACHYNAATEEYIAYLRSWCYGRRSVAMATSRDFRHFGNLRQVLWPAADMAPYETWYTPSYSVMPSASDYQLMFATRWSQLDDEFVPFLHASPDGEVWTKVPGEVLPPHELRPGWSRCGLAMSTLVPLPDKRVGSLVGGWHVPHKFPRQPPFGQLGWVWWPQDRITAVRANREGKFWLYPLHFRGREMVLNYRTQASGSIRIGASTAGHEIENCDVLNGNEIERVVTWNGRSDIGHVEGEPVQFEIQMTNADLFSIRFR